MKSIGVSSKLKSRFKSCFYLLGNILYLHNRIKADRIIYLSTEYLSPSNNQQVLSIKQENSSGGRVVGRIPILSPKFLPLT